MTRFFLVFLFVFYLVGLFTILFVINAGADYIPDYNILFNNFSSCIKKNIHIFNSNVFRYYIYVG